MSRSAFLSWSGGKDSAYALYDLRRSGDVTVVGLLTTVTAEHDRISIHGVRRTLLAQQADALGLPLREVVIPASCSNADYESAFGAALAQLRSEGIETVAYGDLFLEEIRTYRNQLMARLDMHAIYPLWGRDTSALARAVLRDGFAATIVCVDLEALPDTFCGRPYDAAFLADLPAGVDPCGENGEFHTFVHTAPDYDRPIPIRTGERVVRGRFCFCDLEPAIL